jgi:hypothetical protein
MREAGTNGTGMERAYRYALFTVLLSILWGMALPGCGDDAGAERTAEVRVVLGGLTTRTGAVDVVLVPDVYDFLVTGTADRRSAHFTLTVYDRMDVEITSVQFDLSLEEANAEAGDTGSGENTGVRVVEGLQSIEVDFHWQPA